MKKTLIALLFTAAVLLTACSGEKLPVTPQIGGEIQTGKTGNGKLPTYTAVTETAASDALALLGATAESKTVNDGLEIDTLSFGDSKAYVMTVQLDKLTLSATVPFNTKPFGTNQSLKGQAEVLEKEGKAVFGGITANPMNLSINEPFGFVIKDGKKVYDKGFNDGSVYFGIYEDGKAFAATYSQYTEIYQNKVTTAVSGTHMLLLDGKRQVLYGDDDQDADRVGVGFTADRGTVVLVYGENLTATELTSVLLSNHCSVAVSLISGDLACMICDGTDYGTLAPVGPALFVTEK